jgi:hypothetical protein
MKSINNNNLKIYVIMNQGIFIAALAIFCSLGLPLITALVLGLKWMTARNKERMGLINQGIIPPHASSIKKATPNRFVSLRNGIVLVSLGIGIVVGFILSNISNDNIQIGGFFSLAASIVFFLGVGYMTYFFVTRKMTMTDENENDLTQE